MLDHPEDDPVTLSDLGAPCWGDDVRPEPPMTLEEFAGQIADWYCGACGAWNGIVGAECNCRSRAVVAGMLMIGGE